MKLTALEAACEAARRYAQLIYYHDRRPGCYYPYKPLAAWNQFRRQFVWSGSNFAEYAAICFSFSGEMKRLTKADQARRSGGPLPPVANITGVR